MRQADAQKRTRLYEDIMQAAPNDTRLFHRLINNQRTSTVSKGNVLRIDGDLIDDPTQVLEAWTDHFRKLATPNESASFDESYRKLVNDDVLVIQMMLAGVPDIEPYTEISAEEVVTAITRLNNNKASDITGLCAEHLKSAPQVLAPILANLFNMIIRSGHYVDILNTAYVTPIHKKGKDHLLTDNYRGITIIEILNKTLEHIILNRISPCLKQSKLQFGFTKGLSPALAILMVTEVIADARDSKHPLYIITLDVRKAFDVVDHGSLLRKLFFLGIDLHSLQFIANNLRTQVKVKLQNSYGEPFQINQGVGQGKIISTFNYKSYVNDLLNQFESSSIGSHVAKQYMGAPAFADDIILEANNAIDIQTQLNLAAAYADKERYEIHPNKTKCISFNVDHPCRPLLNGNVIETTESITHLGIQRFAGRYDPDEAVEDRISLARRTAYSLMGTGFHGTNGITPEYSINIYRTYVYPRLVYGLEAITISTKHLTALSNYHCKTLRDLQSLPTRTAKAAVYLLSGVPPLECLLDISLATLLIQLSRAPQQPLRYVGLKILASKPSNSSSWFVYCARRLARYDLAASDVLEGKLKKSSVTSRIRSFWLEQIKEEALQKTSLKYLYTAACSFDKCHAVWKNLECNKAEVAKAAVKVKLLTGVYILQQNRAQFNQYQVDPTCPLCKDGAEDRHHLLLHCAATNDIRQKHFTTIETLIPGFNTRDDVAKTQLLLDSSSNQGSCDSVSLEAVTRTLVYSIICRRTNILNAGS